MHVLITGGAGFIGSNMAHRFASKGHFVRVFDNMSRPGSIVNAEWLQNSFPDLIEIVRGDVTDLNQVKQAVESVSAVFHCAGQVAVTTSVADPISDFRCNAEGTLYLLEVVRTMRKRPFFLYTSTNKVYGALTQHAVIKKNNRYAFFDLPYGVSEDESLDFHSPYGCSKGVADQYVRDYARIYNLQTVVFRQSCIYGPRQFGVEDQGWVAWFIIAALHHMPISVYGDGFQVRDILYIDDFLEACERAYERREEIAGEIFNIGGGVGSAISIWHDMKRLLETVRVRVPAVSFADWRPGDQKIYVSDIRKSERLLGWRPQIMPEEGIARVVEWVRAHRDYFKSFNKSS